MMVPREGKLASSMSNEILPKTEIPRTLSLAFGRGDLTVSRYVNATGRKTIVYSAAS